MVNCDINYFVNLKHRFERERALITSTPQDHVIALSREADRILAVRLDRDGICSMPCDKSIIARVLSTLDIAISLNDQNNLRHTVAVVFDNGEAFVVALTWDDSPQMTMTVYANEVLVINEQC
jgi:pyruvate/oxaloacetate carboxyltransferase